MAGSFASVCALSEVAPLVFDSFLDFFFPQLFLFERQTEILPPVVHCSDTSNSQRTSSKSLTWAAGTQIFEPSPAISQDVCQQVALLKAEELQFNQEL